MTSLWSGADAVTCNITTNSKHELHIVGCRDTQMHRLDTIKGYSIPQQSLTHGYSGCCIGVAVLSPMSRAFEHLSCSTDFASIGHMCSNITSCEVLRAERHEYQFWKLVVPGRAAGKGPPYAPGRPANCPVCVPKQPSEHQVLLHPPAYASSVTTYRSITCHAQKQPQVTLTCQVSMIAALTSGIKP